MPHRALGYLGLHPFDRRCQRQGAEIALVPIANTDRSRLGIARSDHQHIRQQLQLPFADFRAELFRAKISRDAQTGRL
jgi:hypothetical protein